MSHVAFFCFYIQHRMVEHQCIQALQNPIREFISSLRFSYLNF